jgi:hypothetical protein
LQPSTTWHSRFVADLSNGNWFIVTFIQLNKAVGRSWFRSAFVGFMFARIYGVISRRSGRKLRRPKIPWQVGTEFPLAAYIRANTGHEDFGHSKICAVNIKVPLARYFFFVGSLLLAMLFLADWYVPTYSSPTFGREARIDKSIIRIKSAHKWPEQVVFDTSLPTIVPPSAPVLAQGPIIDKPREAFAQVNAPLPKVLEHPAPVRATRKVARQVPATRIAAYRETPEALPAGW